MYSNRIWRWAALAAALAAFIAAAVRLNWIENNSCMGVRMQSQQEDPGEYAYMDLSRYLEFNGEPAAVDVETSTVYLSQDILEGTQPEALPGTLAMTHLNYSLRFTPDERFEDMASAVADGHSFTLLAVSGDGTYMEYQVIFTTLPVVRLDGYYSHMNPEERDVMLGDVCLWAPKDPATGRYSVKTSTTEWHVRGGTTASQPKKPWKLALEKEGGENNNVDFLGLGADDDWILNPMSMDETKIKENLFMQLWNSWAEQAPWNHRMSTGEYVELVLNGSYEGVYFLQKRIDQKYLQLQDEDIFLKGGASFVPESLEVAYQIFYSPLSEEETFALMKGIYTGEDTSLMDLDNFLDTNLFLQYASAEDNACYKNMYYLLEKEAEGYRFSLLPWDTDLSWGVLWDEVGINWYTYNYDMGMEMDLTRQEYRYVKRQVPELDTLMAQRWQLLRQSVLSEEHILNLVDEICAQLQRSGVMQREWQRWDPVFGGEDTVEKLYQFLRERLWKLDVYYSEFLQE